MRFKRQFKELEKEDAEFKDRFHGTKPRVDDLQSEIFSCKPFDLERDTQLDEQFPQEYF